MSEITRNQAIQIVEDIRTAISAGSVTNTMEAQVLEYCVSVLGRRIVEASLSGHIENLPDVAAFLAGISPSATLKALLEGITDAVEVINANIGNGYVYAGIATPSGTPVNGKVFYLAKQAGQYANFGGLTVTEGVNILKRNGSTWTQEQLLSMADIHKNPLIGYYECDTAGDTSAKTVTAAGYVLPATGGSVKIKMANRNTVANATLNINSTGAKPLYYNGQRAGVGNTWDTNEIIEVFYDGAKYQAYNVAGCNGDGVFDISAYNLTDGQPTPYEDLAAALGPNGDNVPLSLRKGGMRIKFVQTGNKYIQFRYLLEYENTTSGNMRFSDTSNWEEINNNIELVLQNHAELSTKEVVPFAAHVTGKFYDETGEHDNQYYFYNKYAVQPNTVYCFSSKFLKNTSIYFIYWYDENNNYIDKSQYGHTTTDPIILENQAVLSPAGAAFAYLNCALNYADNVQFYKSNEQISSFGLKTDVDRNIAQILKNSNTAIGCVMAPVSKTNGIINGKGNKISMSNFQYWKYNVEQFAVYSFKGKYSANSAPVIVSWYDIEDKLIYQEPYKSGNVTTEFDNQIVIAPRNASYMYLNVDTRFRVEYFVVRRISYYNDEVMDSNNMDYISPLLYKSGKFYYTDGERENESCIYEKFEVEAGKVYAFSSILVASQNIPYVIWCDENNNIISNDVFSGGTGDEVKEQKVIAPGNAAFVYINCYRYSANKLKLKQLTGTILSYDLKQYGFQTKADISEKTLLNPNSIEEGFLYYGGEIRQNQYFEYWIYSVIEGHSYSYSGNLGPSTTGIYCIHWFDSENNWIGSEPYQGGAEEVLLENIAITAPTGAAYAYINVNKTKKNLHSFNEVGKAIQSSKLKKDIENAEIRIGTIEEDLIHGKTKVVIKMLQRPVSSTVFNNAVFSTAFYVRAKYNTEKDIIIDHWYNGNQLVSFYRTFIGANTLSDEQIMVDSNIVSTHNDSTGPLNTSTQYWHLYAQHGVPMPAIANNVGMTSNDVGAEWKDQLERHYKVGFVTTGNIYLIPVMYQDDNGHWVRDWKNRVHSTAISSLNHVSGGTYTTAFTVSGYTQVQLRPVMSFKDRTFLIDGKEVTETGTYYCDDFKVNETAIGYDPVTITDWFGGPGNNVDLTGAEPLAEFTFSYNYKGAQCCVNTTLHLLKEFQCAFYGAIQQQFFYDNGDYKAMFLVPKAKTIDGVVMDKPFNSPSNSSPSHYIYRTTNHLKNIDDPVDRQIGYLYDSNTGKYLVGMAAGLSLVSGDTITSKRIQNCLEGNSGNYRWVLLDFSPANTNKFYIAAVNTSAFANDDYYFPAGYFKEINYYVSYFDPAENVGQVYWYKDGSRFVIYAHCQSQQSALAINVPECMEGRSLTVVEKTTDAELLTDTIQNGKFFVNYNSDDANYIVLKAE